MPFIAQYTEGDGSWILILAVIVVMGIANSFAQGGIFGFAGIFPPRYTGAVMFGNGFSGLAMNILRMCTLLAFPPKEIEEGKHDNTAFIGCMIYFAIASLIIILCIVGYFYVLKTEFAQYYMKKAGPETNSRSVSLNVAARSAGSIGHADSVKLYNGDNEDTYERVNDRINDDEDQDQVSFLGVYKEVAFMATQVFVCFTITFVVFPGTQLSTTFDFLGNSAADIAWFSVLMITVFNVFDTIGRFAGGSIQVLSPNTVFGLTITRLIFIPTSVLIQLNYSPDWIFQKDWFRILNMAIFAFTNGYNSTL
eukprot:CAMPEP_0205819138 /NCGR_PEP_ID=MMETSP0206-20130828/1382_1 /ASSEMBLY_ACC=CAM_ASM_000279 /TAXON_ID=36767 /ORGANISM="Euplotes focardii, Strain TN1" /LENGTH=307 /DNA_ID=CAMNT_0053112353 /DNA_START=439 /DNA_END=1362 /DNA_ORIENTATION=+